MPDQPLRRDSFRETSGKNAGTFLGAGWEWKQRDESVCPQQIQKHPSGQQAASSHPVSRLPVTPCSGGRKAFCSERKPGDPRALIKARARQRKEAEPEAGRVCRSSVRAHPTVLCRLSADLERGRVGPQEPRGPPAAAEHTSLKTFQTLFFSPAMVATQTNSREGQKSRVLKRWRRSRERARGVGW